MKNSVKEIIEEAVLAFLNEGARWERPEDKKKIELDPHKDVSFDVDVKSKEKKKKDDKSGEVIVHPSYHKPSVDYTAHGVNEEESAFDENTKKKFLRAIGNQVNESMNLKA